MRGIITDYTEVLRIKESIREGQLTLKTGMFNGRKLSIDEMWQVRKSVENAEKKIGESIMPEKGYTIEDVTPEGYAPAEPTRCAICGIERKGFVKGQICHGCFKITV